MWNCGKLAIGLLFFYVDLVEVLGIWGGFLFFFKTKYLKTLIQSHIWNLCRQVVGIRIPLGICALNCRGIVVGIVWHMESPFDLTIWLLRSNCAEKHIFWESMWKKIFMLKWKVRDVLMCNFFYGNNDILSLTTKCRWVVKCCLGKRIQWCNYIVVNIAPFCVMLKCDKISWGWHQSDA